MFKVSFKEENKRVQVFNNKATIVTLVGETDSPFCTLGIVPPFIYNWMRNHPSVKTRIGRYTSRGVSLILETTGMSVCAEGDTFNPVIGERIAESRAKVRLYKFIHNLCNMLMKEFYGFMYGNAEFDVIRESHTEAPKDCLYLTCKKYRELWIKESHHLGKLLEEVQ